MTGITRDEGVPFVRVGIRNDETSQEAAVNLLGDSLWHSDDPLAKAQERLRDVIDGLLPQGDRAAPGDQEKGASANPRAERSGPVLVVEDH